MTAFTVDPRTSLYLCEYIFWFRRSNVIKCMQYHHLSNVHPIWDTLPKLEFWNILAWTFSAQYRLKYPIFEVKTKSGEYISCSITLLYT